MTKKNIKVKKDNHDISITIENNLNANNKQINHDPIKRRRRKKKVENNDEIDTLEELPTLTDTSYIKPGPIGAFKMLRPAQPGAGGGGGTQEISFDNFQRFLAMLMENQRNGNPANNVRPPPAWGRSLVDDDEPVIIPPPRPADDDLSFSDLVLDDDDDDDIVSRADSDIVSSVDSDIDSRDTVIDPDSVIDTRSDTTDDDTPTLLRKKTIFVGGGGKQYYDPPKRPPPVSAVLKQLLEKLPADKAAKNNLIYELVKKNLIGALKTGPRRNTESLEAGPLMRD
jgi:hypothetical protein